MRRLIVNADDFNTDPPRSSGILSAARKGIVTSASVLTNTASCEESRRALQDLFASGAGVGVHLNLTKGTPLCRGASSLTLPDGSLYPKPAAWRRALRGCYCPGDAEREFAAQIEELFKTGHIPDHIDGNNHMHVFPGLAGAAARAALQFGIRRVRLPREPLFWSLRRPGRAVVKKCFILFLSFRAEKVFRRAGLCFPDRCAGLHVPATAEEQSVVDFLNRLPEGTTELMCHPGHASSENPYSTADRERELSALTSERVLRAVASNNIRLICFRDLPCE